MINIKFYSIYEKAEDYKGTPNGFFAYWYHQVLSLDEADIAIFTDFKVTERENIPPTKAKKYALMIEPRMFDGIKEQYEYVEKNWNKFDIIYTHDSILLNKCPNAKLLYWGKVWAWSDKQKTKNISTISSDKAWCPLHKKRLEIVRKAAAEGLIDCYGTFDGGKHVTTEEAHQDYRFAFVMENYIDDYWFTEKILNCFANKVVPFYYGARKIGDYFNMDGVIILDKPEDIFTAIKDFDFEAEYNKRLQAINENYERVKFFSDFWQVLYNMYKKDFEKQGE